MLVQGLPARGTRRTADVRRRPSVSSGAVRVPRRPARRGGAHASPTSLRHLEVRCAESPVAWALRSRRRALAQVAFDSRSTALIAALAAPTLLHVRSWR